MTRLPITLPAWLDEEWRPVVGYEGLYEVSDQGQVRSLARVTRRANGRLLPVPGRLMKAHPDDSGHLRVRLSRQGASGMVAVHVLVAAAFIGPRPPGLQTCHYDDDPTNNRPANLRYDTASANLLDRVRNGRHQGASKTACKWGHPFTPENTRYQAGGRKRACIACALRRSAEHRARKRAAR